MIVDKLAISQIMVLLNDQSLSPRDIAENLNMNPSDVSRHLNSSTRQRLVKFDESEKVYALA